MTGPARLLDEARLALMLLTRLPAGRIADPVPAMRDSAWAYPLAGLAVGSIGGAFLWLSYALGLPALAGAFLSLAAMALATGAMHEDGLADTADGFGGGATKERKLEIMRDSRVGSYGMLALVLVVGLRASAVAALSPGFSAALAVIATAMASRSVLPVVMAMLPPARSDGLGHGAGAPNTPVWAASLTLGLAAMILLLPSSALVPALLAGGAVTLAISVLSVRQIGGQTGDTLGATQTLTETAILLAVSALA
ncbi:MAG: adenosylcobinamide-GDP ribazoletransferase [Notoacmeibacter sp.]|nr:adenosylcobinamide-GDP ribazoletransferase [Notoacmeibacter sp.]MCC0031990.1 adenosylcobinamide-GDP ribazoletransferase [Brucellaceae bacterium]